MEMTWREVKNMIEDEIDKIWWEEPEEFTMARRGYFPSGVNVDGSVFGNLFFLVADTSSIGRHVTEPAIYAALDDDEIDLKVIKKMWVYLTGGTARLLGSKCEPKCPAPWLNLGNVWKFYQAMEGVLDTIQTKEDFRQLYYSWANYLTCLNRWAMITFPWDLGWDKTPLAQK